MLSTPQPFILGTTPNERYDTNRKRRGFQNGSKSNLHTIWKIYNGFINEYKKMRYCRENCLSYRLMQTAHGIFTLPKRRSGSLNYIYTMNPGKYKCVNSNQRHWTLIHACFTTTFYPNLCISNVQAANQFHDLRLGENVTPHHQSVIYGRNYEENTNAIYSDKSKNRKRKIFSLSVLPS